MASTSKGDSDEKIDGKLCSKSRQCSKQDKHPGKCNSERKYPSFWSSTIPDVKHSLKRDFDEEAEKMKDEFEAKLARVGDEREQELSRKEAEINQLREETETTLIVTKEKVEFEERRLDQLKQEFEKIKILLEQTKKARSKRANNATTENISNVASTTRYRRRKETSDILTYIHGSEEGACFGAWDFIASTASKDTIEKLISNYKRGPQPSITTTSPPQSLSTSQKSKNRENKTRNANSVISQLSSLSIDDSKEKCLSEAEKYGFTLWLNPSGSNNRCFYQCLAKFFNKEEDDITRELKNSMRDNPFIPSLTDEGEKLRIDSFISDVDFTNGSRPESWRETVEALFNGEMTTHAVIHVSALLYRLKIDIIDWNGTWRSIPDLTSVGHDHEVFLAYTGNHYMLLKSKDSDIVNRENTKGNDSPKIPASYKIDEMSRENFEIMIRDKLMKILKKILNDDESRIAKFTKDVDKVCDEVKREAGLKVNIGGDKLDQRAKSTTSYQERSILPGVTLSPKYLQSNSGGAQGQEKFSKLATNNYHDIQKKLLFEHIGIDETNELSTSQFCDIIDALTEERLRRYVESAKLDGRERLREAEEMCRDVLMGRIATDAANSNDLLNPNGYKVWKDHMNVICSFAALLASFKLLRK